MSTLTPNYGLIVPEGTDTVEQVRADYATNLNTIDGIGGGGSCGHTIVNENGTDMPAESKLQFTGGVTVTDDSVNGKTVVDISGSSVVELTQAEYEALPDSKLTDDILYGLKDVKSFLDADILYLGTCYSTSERMVGCWVDGKPLYQITIDFGSDRTFSSGWQSFANKADYPDYDYISAGMLYASSGVCTHVDLAHNDVTYLELRPKASAGGRYLTYQYTKTTDVAGSGTWTPSGVNAVHYDTNEQVIGTWIDGKPLYQKTVNFGSIPSNSTKEVDHNISNLKMTISFEGTMMSGTVCETLPSGENSNFRIQTTSSKLKIITGASWSGWDDSYITIKYTKTTD